MPVGLFGWLPDDVMALVLNALDTASQIAVHFSSHALWHLAVSAMPSLVDVVATQTQYLVLHAAHAGHTKLMSWSQEMLMCRSEEVTRHLTPLYAAKVGRLGVFYWIRDHCGHAPNDLTSPAYCVWATACNHELMLRVLQAEGYAWHEDVVYIAAVCGNLEIVQYAVTNGCPFLEEHAISYALIHCQTKVAAWLIWRNPACMYTLVRESNVFFVLVKLGHRDVFQWLTDNMPAPMVTMESGESPLAYYDRKRPEVSQLDREHRSWAFYMCDLAPMSPALRHLLQHGTTLRESPVDTSPPLVFY